MISSNEQCGNLMGGGIVCNCNNVQEKVDPAYMHVRTSLLGGILGGQEESISMCCLSHLRSSSSRTLPFVSSSKTLLSTKVASLCIDLI